MRHSNGTAGETAAQYWFTVHGWRMHRHQPATKVIGRGAGKRIINCDTGGIADYTGHEAIELHDGRTLPLFRACEVKEAKGDRMPCSRLGRKQRAYMDSLPNGCAWVGVLWVDHSTFEMFHYQQTGSYTKGDGMA